jgi:hypothetical protein
MEESMALIRVNRVAAALGLLALPMLTACGDDADVTVADWTKAANAVCADINAARAEAAEATFPDDDAVTADHLQAFYAAFEPDYRAAMERIGDLDRPSEIDDQVEEVVTAGRAFANYMASAAADDVIARNDLAADGDTEAHRALEQAGPDLDLSTCKDG